MIWEEKYQPSNLRPCCPVCGRHISLSDWYDYGMHFRCTEYYQKKLNAANQNNLVDEKAKP